MLRTDHCYPPTVHAPLYPTVADHHFEAITMPAPLPPVVEPLAPTPEVVFTGDEAEALWRMQQDARHRWGGEARRLVASPPWAITPIPAPAKPDHGLSTLAACAVGAALFAIGYLLGRWLP